MNASEDEEFPEDITDSELEREVAALADRLDWELLRTVIYATGALVLLAVVGSMIT
ncbi:hypothetical protein [Rubrivivax gelatinosus]|uniref:hypothetical protein n=1 Tax=Rubrivivax gelatinosus TaxID=28068 RepID=UPI001904F6A3|nr:hypothetical protein [Rubrivivax gelatinosus]